MQQLLDIMRDLATDPNAVSVAYQRIEDFHKLVVDQLPYGTIDPNGLVQGLVEFDGPAQDPPNLKKPLQWHFGGTPYEVCKAIRIRYSYQKYLEGTYLTASGSLFIGYQFGQPYPSVFAQAIKDAQAELARATGADEAAAKAKLAALQRADPATASTATTFTTAQEIMDALKADFVNSPNRVTALAKYVDKNDFDAFLLANVPFQPAAAQSVWGEQPTLSALLTSELTAGMPGVRIQFDGPARTYDSRKPFPYTTDTLFNEPSGMYDKLLWWYFGGRAFRITKAMRLGFTDPQGHAGSLLIGYQGPGPY